MRVGFHLNLAFGLLPVCFAPSAQATSPRSVFVYCSTGDSQWDLDAMPVDSPATIDAMCEWLASTYGVKRLYWRGEQDRMWLQYFHLRPENPVYYDYWNAWTRHLTDVVKTNEAAVASAKRRGMQIYILYGLYDHGNPGETSGCQIYPASIEDRLRIEHPEWCPIDRWGERIGPGPVEFCYPQVRKLLVERYVHHVVDYGYDGILFYTYVENAGWRYKDEFGFNDPYVREFKRRYGVDVRTQDYDKQAWYKLRGEYLDQFIRDLHAALAAKGKKLAITLYSPTPNFPEPWDGSKTDVPTAGMTYLDWEGWVAQGIVDELMVWWRGDQKALLSRLTAVCKGKPVDLTVTSRKPFDDEWKPFVDAGVTPVGVWAPGYGVDRLTSEPGPLENLHSTDWRWRLQTLADIAAHRIKADGSMVAPLARDPHVLVRVYAMRCLKALEARGEASALEGALDDPESSVRIEAANALSKFNSAQTASRILAAIRKDDGFQMKMACVEALAALSAGAKQDVIRALSDPLCTIREVCVKALGTPAYPSPRFALGAPIGEISPEQIAALLKIIRSDPDGRVRFYALAGLARIQTPEITASVRAALHDSESSVQLQAAGILGERVKAMSAQESREVLTSLLSLFRDFGDACRRPDAAWGWRAVGNAILAFGPEGREGLEQMRAQRGDHWLSWLAYEVLYVRQSPDKATVCSEQEGLESHANFAPPFPGLRQ